MTRTWNRYHDVHNEDCPQNHVESTNLNCTCKRKVNRKPFRVVRVHDTGVLHGAKPDIIMEIHNRGTLVFREKGRPRRFSYTTTVGKVYSRLVMNEALVKAAAKAREKAAKRAAKKKQKKKMTRLNK